MDITNLVIELSDGRLVELERFTENGQSFIEVIDTENNDQLCVFEDDDSLNDATEQEIAELVEYYI